MTSEYRKSSTSRSLDRLLAGVAAAHRPQYIARYMLYSISVLRTGKISQYRPMPYWKLTLKHAIDSSLLGLLGTLSNRRQASRLNVTEYHVCFTTTLMQQFSKSFTPLSSALVSSPYLRRCQSDDVINLLYSEQSKAGPTVGGWEEGSKTLEPIPIPCLRFGCWVYSCVHTAAHSCS